MKLLFIYDHKYPELWKDGLWAALELLKKDGFEIDIFNLQYKDKDKTIGYKTYDVTIGWGAFNSPTDIHLSRISDSFAGKKCLCLGGYAKPKPGRTIDYDVLFYETEWAMGWLAGIPIKSEVIHAFGVNTDIYKPIPDVIKIWDWVSVGAFALWKRQQMLLDKGGYRLAIGEIQKENYPESLSIIGDLLKGGIAISDMQDAETLAKIYNSAHNVYIPADVMGGGERAVLEARACGIPVEVEYDNPKLQELVRSPVWSHYYYFDQLKKGILAAYERQ